MNIRNRFISGAFKSLIALCGLAGILIQSGIFDGNFNISVFRYYTLLSNVLCTLYFGAAAVFAFTGKDKPLPGFKGALIMGITVTGLVYHFMLSGGTFSMGGAMAAANMLLHYFVPVFSVLDWLLFDEKSSYKALSPIKWAVLPDIYFLLATAYGFLGGDLFYGGSRFPYFFMDYDVLGVWGVLLYVLILNVFFIALGYIFYLIDRLMGKRVQKQSTQS